MRSSFFVMHSICKGCPLQRVRDPLSGGVIFVNIRLKINLMPCPVERRFNGGEIGFSVL
jgi:hypothetical protein